MTALKRLAALLLAALMCMGLSVCDFLPSEEFNDYDVSGYIQALLDSSYHDDHRAFMAISQALEDSAKANNITTVENAAINFCNAYSLNPDEEQMERLEGVMATALMGARYQVKDEVKVETGYTVEVTVSPITTFAGLTGEFTSIRSQAQEEVNRTSMENLQEGEGQEDGGEDGDEWNGEEGEEPAPTPVPTPAPQMKTAAELYLDRVLDLCEQKAAALEFGGEDTVIVLDIRLTDKGELQLDLNQIDEIDRAVLAFTVNSPILS